NDGQPREMSPDTIASYLSAEIAKVADIEEPQELIRVVGTAGSGTTARENEVKRFSEMRVEAAPVIDRTEFETALRSLQTRMAEEPVFEEVNSFDSSVASQTQQAAIMAIVISWLAIVGYLWFRFQDISYG